MFLLWRYFPDMQMGDLWFELSHTWGGASCVEKELDMLKGKWVKPTEIKQFLMKARRLISNCSLLVSF
jgi:hypothetical protein